MLRSGRAGSAACGTKSHRRYDAMAFGTQRVRADLVLRALDHQRVMNHKPQVEAVSYTHLTLPTKA